MKSTLSILLLLFNIVLTLLRMVYSLFATLISWNISFMKMIKKSFNKTAQKAGYKKYQRIMEERIKGGATA